MGATSPPSSTRSGAPGALQRLLQNRSVRLATGLAVAVAIPVAILFYFQFRSLSDLAQTSTVVLRQLSQETANELTRRVDDELKSPYIRVLLRVNQGLTEPLNVDAVEPMLTEGLRDSPFIDAFYVWSSIDEQFADRVLELDRSALDASPSAVGGSPPSRFRPDPAEGPALVRHLRELAVQKRAIVTYQTTIGGRTKHVQAQLRFNNPATRERLTSFVALAVDAERLRTEYFPAMLAAELRTVQGPTGFPPLVATLVDEGGRVVFHSGEGTPGAFVDEREFPLIFFDRELLEYAAPLEIHREIWRLRTGYGDQTIPQIAWASVRPQIGMMAFLAVIMAAGVFFVSHAAAREVRLAELKSNFVSSVSHDLKTPLALIQLFAETLELGRVKTADRAQEYYRIINSEARKLTRLINNILDFSRIEAGLRMYRMELVDLPSLVKRVVTSLDSHFAQHNFTVTVREADRVPPVMADGEAVAQALENLLSNAMKYSPTDRRIEVEIAREGREASIRVIDHGIGVPARQLRKIFRKFYRVEPDDALGPQGSGLGLAIVDHIMRAHQGVVKVDSEPGRGSTFTLSFPVPDEGSPASAPAHDVEAARRAS